MIIFLKLLFAHLLADFVFQPTTWVKDKEIRGWKSPKLYLHIGVYALLTSVVLFESGYWFGLVILIPAHYGIDILKIILQKKFNDQRAWLFLADQLLHVASLVLVAEYCTAFLGEIKISWNWVLLLGVFLLLVTSASSVIIKSVMSSWSHEIQDGDEDSLLRAGRTIGILERLFVFAFVITDQWEAVGFLLAAKSVFRFGDLKESRDRKLTEYILIGTLLSFGVAILLGVVYLRLLNTISE